MATQGILSITRKGKTVIKVVTGSDGYNIPKLLEYVKSNSGLTAQDIWHKAKSMFSVDSLVVQTSPTEIICECESPLLDDACNYKKKFSDPSFNPRWEFGTADYCEILELQES